ncbi:FIG002776: hypothetical protein [uncultured Candidatus Thioglobus sp.]|nr:FIG002776: hypothetical protein [uncultured Candidatus Thioglobus sp.]
MIHFGKISQQQFLSDYWQKKPLLIKQALPDFISPISPDELGGLALEPEFESRLITGSTESNDWLLRNGPLNEQDFSELPEQDWTLLVQGVDKYIDEVHQLIRQFDFIPRWRFDDVMISYAATGGSVGPHFDYYDVFLLQGTGRRRWHLSTQYCNIDNYLKNVPLRIMDKFYEEQVFDVEPGDVLYVPPEVAHHGVSLDDKCTTLSFGYRHYSANEFFNDISEKPPKNLADRKYIDPEWTNTDRPAFIPPAAIKQAQHLLNITPQQFAQVVTKLDALDVEKQQIFEYNNQNEAFDANAIYELYPIYRVAYLDNNTVFINGELLVFDGADSEVILNFCNSRMISASQQPQLAQQLFKLNLILLKTFAG